MRSSLPTVVNKDFTPCTCVLGSFQAVPCSQILSFQSHCRLVHKASLCIGVRSPENSQVYSEITDHPGYTLTFLSDFLNELANQKLHPVRSQKPQPHLLCFFNQNRNLGVIVLFVLLYFFKTSPRKVKCTQCLFQSL